MTDFSNLSTEGRNPDTMDLDCMSISEIISVMNREDAKTVVAVGKVLPQIERAIELVTSSLRSGGKIIYIGAGTSGRLGVLDASECPPTFGVGEGTFVGLIAGGKKALINAVENAEDSTTLAREDLEKIGLKAIDTVIGLSASGRTPYVVYGLRYAKELGCHTAIISTNKNCEIGKELDVAIEPLVGPEVLSGSTRLKSGTAQKMILNMISTVSMVKMGYVYENLMVNMNAHNEKLAARTLSMVIEATGCNKSEAEHALHEAKGNVKAAIVMLKLDISAMKARKLLEHSKGYTREALKAGGL